MRDGRVIAPAFALYSAVPAERWSPWSRTLEDGGVIVELGGYLVQGSGFNVLVDAGFGPAWAPNGHAAFLDSLAEFGLDPGDITDVIFTHLHFDHVGWASNDAAPTFPNATYRAAAADWSYFVRESHELTRARSEPCQKTGCRRCAWRRSLTGSCSGTAGLRCGPASPRSLRRDIRRVRR